MASKRKWRYKFVNYIFKSQFQIFTDYIFILAWQFITDTADNRLEISKDQIVQRYEDFLIVAVTYAGISANLTLLSYNEPVPVVVKNTLKTSTPSGNPGTSEISTLAVAIIGVLLFLVMVLLIVVMIRNRAQWRHRNGFFQRQRVIRRRFASMKATCRPEVGPTTRRDNKLVRVETDANGTAGPAFGLRSSIIMTSTPIPSAQPAWTVDPIIGFIKTPMGTDHVVVNLPEAKQKLDAQQSIAV